MWRALPPMIGHGADACSCACPTDHKLTTNVNTRATAELPHLRQRDIRYEKVGTASALLHAPAPHLHAHLQKGAQRLSSDQHEPWAHASRRLKQKKKARIGNLRSLQRVFPELRPRVVAAGSPTSPPHRQELPHRSEHTGRGQLQADPPHRRQISNSQGLETAAARRCTSPVSLPPFRM